MEELEKKIQEELAKLHKRREKYQWIRFRSFIANTTIAILVFLYLLQAVTVDMVLGWGSIVATLATLWNYFRDDNKDRNIKRVLGLAVGIIILALSGDFGGYLVYR